VGVLDHNFTEQKLLNLLHSKMYYRQKLKTKQILLLSIVATAQRDLSSCAAMQARSLEGTLPTGQNSYKNCTVRPHYSDYFVLSNNAGLARYPDNCN